MQRQKKEGNNERITYVETQDGDKKDAKFKWQRFLKQNKHTELSYEHQISIDKCHQLRTM
jgi:hypothetical protein